MFILVRAPPRHVTQPHWRRSQINLFKSGKSVDSWIFAFHFRPVGWSECCQLQCLPGDTEGETQPDPSVTPSHTGESQPGCRTEGPQTSLCGCTTCLIPVRWLVVLCCHAELFLSTFILIFIKGSELKVHDKKTLLKRTAKIASRHTLSRTTNWFRNILSVKNFIPRSCYRFRTACDLLDVLKLRSVRSVKRGTDMTCSVNIIARDRARSIRSPLAVLSPLCQCGARPCFLWAVWTSLTASPAAGGGRGGKAGGAGLHRQPRHVTSRLSWRYNEHSRHWTVHTQLTDVTDHGTTGKRLSTSRRCRSQTLHLVTDSIRVMSPTVNHTSDGGLSRSYKSSIRVDK